MPTIVISNPESQLSTDQTHFTLRSKGRKIGRIPPMMMDQVVVHHGVEVSRRALDRLGALGIPTSFLDPEGRVRARLVSPWRHDPAPRLGQAAAHFDSDTRLSIARGLVAAKIANQAAMLRNHASNHPDSRLSATAACLMSILDDLAGARTIESVMGFEGIAGREYFGAFPRMLRCDWTVFAGRNRQPPRDPVNALLSYTYAVLTNQLASLLEAEGLDPYIGYLHASEARRPSLALDLLEPFRPALADRFVLRALNLGQVNAGHFEPPNDHGGVFLSREGRLAVLKEMVGWGQGCDEVLAPKLTSPGVLLRDTAASFKSLAVTRRLAGFAPYRLPLR
jgi:CRISPR-associated protein Cas1